MKKNHCIKKFVFSALLLVFIMSISVSGVSQNDFTSQRNAEKAISILDCDKENLDFIKEVNADIPLTSDDTVGDKVAQNSLDTYVDEDKNTYYYLSGTDTLCGFQKEKYYGFESDSPISQNEAIQIANEFLDTAINEFDEYTLIFSEYAEQDAVYHIQYSYCLNDIPTDDLINIFIQESGEIGAFLMMRRGMYRDVVLPLEFSVPDNSDGVISQFISLTDAGLALIRTYEELGPNSTPVIQQEAILIQSVKENSF